jgi:hypothetical protein
MQQAPAECIALAHLIGFHQHAGKCGAEFGHVKKIGRGRKGKAISCSVKLAWDASERVDRIVIEKPPGR